MKQSQAADHVLHLSKDRKLKKLIESREPFRLKKGKHVHIALCVSIMSQQLSTKVAHVIHKRFLNLFEKGTPTPEMILAVPYDTLRSIGLSNAKTRYVHNVARFAIENGLDFKTLSRMNNDEVIEYLTRIKGVGRWTAEMLLMFTLGREDIFAIDDLGIQNAMIKLYKLDASNKKLFRETMLNISQKWTFTELMPACIYGTGRTENNLGSGRIQDG